MISSSLSRSVFLVPILGAAACLSGLACGSKGTQPEQSRETGLPKQRPEVPRRSAVTNRRNGHDHGTSRPPSRPPVQRLAPRTGARDFGNRPILVIRTSLGDMEVVLFPEKAPRTVHAVLDLAGRHRYDGTLFHRVIQSHLIQGGAFDRTMKRRGLASPILNEADNGLHNLRSTVSLARPDNEPDQGTGEFFVNLSDNLQFDHRGSHPLQRGYTVFGRVIRGMAVADKIGRVRTCRRKPFFGDVPCRPVVILSVRRRKAHP